MISGFRSSLYQSCNDGGERRVVAVEAGDHHRKHNLGLQPFERERMPDVRREQSQVSELRAAVAFAKGCMRLIQRGRDDNLVASAVYREACAAGFEFRATPA
jgi:hypothetical protein